ncbi:MAG: NAD(P)-dependent glycerol-3-phosphate dehydrogenase [Roseovarius sp.]|uniref:NAD(P)H-dependent glycerol-3-phosphate dehydrogenase n=1 Tax=Roseovarius sp. TaxID=1486281 RepID=UPI001B7648AA|nr:NAD(P)H-dependent glycerol-3-phosphate dehydrogenase [Roseovarius sp.]MBQ0750941.1 NAD(P)-dependent glycerol-3-phosphate dehydrogenase [Roseovarius sp.]MBQ0810266.1 NAD(P)-dependent glycerol-3-phosphate dehydrogenase [Roseovarius sp.]
MILICGAGAFGTALAVTLAQNGPVTLWARDAAHAAEMQAARENTRRLPGIDLPDAVTILSGPLPKGDTPCLLAMPMQTLRGFLSEHAETFARRTLVACCKGMDLTTGLGPTGLIAQSCPTATPAILTGPSFARDIALGLPTALTLACADEATGQMLQRVLTSPTLRLYRSTDTIGAELGGALKNVIAIACGAAIGAGLGESARAALMTRGFAEMNRLAATLGAQPQTLAGLSGFGDLALTCTSDQSRNYRYGLSIGQGATFDPTITVEGAATARAVLARAQALGLDMPITHAVTALVTGELRVAQAMDMLLSRPLKEE